MLQINKFCVIIQENLIKFVKIIQFVPLGEFSMIYDYDLRFFFDVCKRGHIGVQLIEVSDFVEVTSRSSIEAALGAYLPRELYASLLASPIMSTTMYKIKDAFGLRYIYFLLPARKERTVLLIGPYVSEMPSVEWILKRLEQYGIAPGKERWLYEYFSSIPVISEGERTLDMINVLCERIWHTVSFTVVDMDAPETEHPITQLTEQHSNLDEAMISIKAIEKRYEFENELMDTVALGQVHKLGQLLTAFSEESFEARTSDRVRNSKNYLIIMNTLLRKAAERGGVHPIHIDKVSGGFARKIERIASVSEISELMAEMFRTYCQLVRSHATAGLSPVVQKTVLLIDEDLSADLSLSALAKALSVSAGYLSTVFKREMGKTVSEYVREVRVNYACHLLKSTDLQIQTVALHCGIMDVQYFSKLFKKETSMTPKEYREK